MNSKQFAERCGIDVRTLRRWIDAGDVTPLYKAGGGHAYFTNDHVAAILEHPRLSKMYGGGRRESETILLPVTLAADKYAEYQEAVRTLDFGSIREYLLEMLPILSTLQQAVVLAKERTAEATPDVMAVPEAFGQTGAPGPRLPTLDMPAEIVAEREAAAVDAA